MASLPTILRAGPVLLVAVLAACAQDGYSEEKSYPIAIGEVRDHLLNRNYVPGSIDGMPGWQVETSLLDARMIVWRIHFEGKWEYHCFTQMTPDDAGRDETLVRTHCVTPANDLPDTPTKKRTVALVKMIDRILTTVTNPFEKKAGPGDRSL